MSKIARKKILFLMPFLGCGGVETTLFSLLDAIDREKYDITLLLLQKKGAFLDRVPPDVHIKEIFLPQREHGVFYGKKTGLLNLIKKGELLKIPQYLLYNARNSITEDRTANAAYFERICDSIPPLKEEYDLAIDYFGYATFTTFYLAEKITAKKKATWLHSIFSRFSPQAFGKWYEKMDIIFSVSVMVGEDFRKLFPSLTTVQPFYNIITPNKIRELSFQGPGFEDDFTGIRILTVGRICHEKGMDLAVEAYKLLRAQGYPVRWYLMGGGSRQERERVFSALTTREEKENFIYLGVCNNPYTFMRQCDIYVQSSRYEGYCTTTNEARILRRPIVMTNVSGAHEQLINGKTGYIVGQTAEEIAEAVTILLKHPEKREAFTRALADLDCDTRSELQKLYALL